MEKISRRGPIPKELVLAKFREIHGDKYQYKLPDFLGRARTDRFQVRCKEDGYVWSSYWELMCTGKGCSVCAKKNIGKLFRERAGDLLTKWKEVHGDVYDYSKVDFANRNNKEKVCIICPEHGEFWQREVYHTQGSGCPTCKYWYLNGRNTTLKECSARLKKAFPKYKFDMGNYVTLGSWINAKCPNPKHPGYETNASTFLHFGRGCPRCSNGLSKPQQTLVDNLPKCIQDKYIVPRLEADLYWPDPQLAVEVDGVYWHSEEFKPRMYHFNKTFQYKRAGIQMLHFWDYEILNKKPIVLSMIRSRLGLSKRLYARKLVVCKLDSKESTEFLKAHHLAGSSACSVSYGLRALDGRLAMVATFGKPRFDTSSEWELIRLASHKGVTVVGGASRLFAAFVSEHSPSSVVSYADLRYSQGRVYKELGFQFQRRTPPNYNWIQNGIQLSRYKCQKSKLSDLLGNKFIAEESEKENMQRNGWHRLFDCGNLVFTYTKDAK